MGTFNVGCLIKNHVNRDQAVEIPRLLVDTGSEATWIPRKLLERIDVKSEKRQVFQMANGQQVYRDVGYAVVRVGQRETIDEVVFAERGDYVLLGARALEGLLLWVDPKNKKLIEIEAHPVAKVIVPGKVPPDKDKPFSTGLVIRAKAGRTMSQRTTTHLGLRQNVSGGKPFQISSLICYRISGLPSVLGHFLSWNRKRWTHT